MIRRAKISQISDILSISKACAAYMRTNGIYQWNQHYPSKEAFLADMEREELYVSLREDKPIGTIVISTLMDEEYKPVKWLTENGNSMYVHRLAVHPNFQGKGHARLLMDFAENHARKHGFSSVRLDTFSQNKRNQKFYETRGYKKLGTIFFPKQSEHPFYCYELLL